MVRRLWITGASIETTLELWASSLRDVKPPVGHVGNKGEGHAAKGLVTGCVGTLYDFEGPASMGLECLPEFVAGIATVGENMSQPRKAKTHRFEHIYGPVTVLNIGGVDEDENQKAAGVGKNVALVHHGKIYPGEHEAIVDRALFDLVQAKLAGRTNVPLSPGARRCVSLLAGMIRDEHGRPMSPVHTRNHGKRYSYYASNRNDAPKDAALRLPAGELDNAIRAELRGLLTDPHRVRNMGRHLEPSQQIAFAASCRSLADTIAAMNTPALRLLLQQLALQVTVSKDGASAELSASLLLGHLGYDNEPDQSLHLTIRTSTTSWGHEPRLRLDPPTGTPAATDANLIQLIARAFATRDELLAMDHDQVAAMPPSQLRHTERTARLAYLAPDIIRAILDGRQPRQVTARALSRLGSLPLSWAQQRQMLGFPAN